MSRVRTGARRGGVIAVAAREVGRVLASPLLLALLAVLPVISSVWLLGVFDAPAPRDLPVAWVDEDDSSASRAVLRMLDATPGIALTTRAASVTEAQSIVRTGGAYAVVVVPRGLHRDLLRGAVPVVTCFHNAQTLLASGVLTRDFQAGVLTASAGAEILAARAGGVPGAALEARVEPIATRQHLLYNPQLNYDYYLLSALLPAILQMLATMAMAVAVGQEFKRGTAVAWMEAARGSAVRAVAGKGLVYAAWFGLLAMAMLATIFGVIEAPVRGSVLVLAGGAWLFVIACLAAGFAIVILSGSLRLAASGVALYTGVAFPFIGITFPALAMPVPARAWAEVIPLTHFVRLLVEQGLRGTAVADSAARLAALGGFVAAAALVSAWPFRRLTSGRRAWRME